MRSESTQEDEVGLGCDLRNYFASLMLNFHPACIITRYAHTEVMNHATIPLLMVSQGRILEEI